MRPFGYNPLEAPATAITEVRDEFGNVIISSDTTGSASGDAFTEFIQYGVFNGSFSFGPAVGSNVDIDGSNDFKRLPYWTGPVSVSGGSITAQWVTDSNSPSGYNLRFTVNAGAAGDEAYFEQIVPIGGTRTQSINHIARANIYRVVATSNLMVGYVSIQYLNASLATTGSLVTGQSTLAADATSYFTITNVTNGTTTARYLRIRIGVSRGTANATDTATIDFTDVRVDPSHVYALISDNTAPASNVVSLISQASGILKLNAAGGAVLWIDGPQHAIYPERASTVLWIPRALSVPGTPATNFHAIYAKLADGLLYSKDDGGNEYLLASLPTATGALTLPTSGTGVGVAFPATQIPSSDANTLDDYEEGTWTPALSYATVGSSSWATTTAVGTYTKIGRVVYVQFTYVGVPTNGTGSGNLQLTTLPFTPMNTASSSNRGAVEFQGYTKANYTWVTVDFQANNTTAIFRASGSGQTLATLAVGDIPTGGTVSITGSGFYFAS